MTVANAAADAKKTGDEIGEIKNTITGYNVFNFVPANGDFATKTNNGVTFTWNDEHTVCTLNGTPTGYAVDRYLFNSSSMMGLEPGKTYFFNVIPSNTATGIDLYFYVNGTLGTSREITVPTYVTIPQDSTGILSRVMAHSEAGAMTNATVRVEILNALPVKDMLYVRSATPYVSNNTLTLGSIRENGWYVIDGSWTATDGPAALDGVGRVLTVECYSPNTIAQNTIKQTVEGVLAPNNRKVFTRIRSGGIWTSWADMTPFTRATIVPTGDSTDRTAEINATLARDGVCILAPGEYYVGNIVMLDGTMLKGSGIGTTKLIMISGESGPCVKMGTRCSVSDISLYGQDSSGYTTQGDRHGVGWVGTYQSESSPGEYPLQGQIENLYIEGFNGGGLYCYRTSMHSESGIQAVNITIYKCWCGVYNPMISEYCQFTNIRANSCFYGAYVSGGNNVFTNCSFTSCTCGLFMYDDGDTATNNSHGSFIGCCFNHSNNNTGIGISISGMDNGEVFVGCQIFYGRINIKWAKGIRFVGCNFGRSTGITVQNSSAVGFDSCQFRSASDSPLTQTSVTGLRFSGCLNYDGTEFNPLA